MANHVRQGMKQRRAAQGQRGMIRASAEGAGIGVGALAVLLFVFCAIASGTENPGFLVAPLSLAAAYLGAFIGGVAAVRRSGDGVMSGLVAGAVMLAAALLLSLLPLPASGFPSSACAIFMLLLLPASVLGSIAGHKREKRKKIRRG